MPNGSGAISLSRRVLALSDLGGFARGWTVSHRDPSLGTEAWALKEDLLQLHHHELDRVADLGWYADRFGLSVHQGDFLGPVLGQAEAADAEAALSALHSLLVRFSVR